MHYPNPNRPMQFGLPDPKSTQDGYLKPKTESVRVTVIVRWSIVFLKRSYILQYLLHVYARLAIIELLYVRLAIEPPAAGPGFRLYLHIHDNGLGDEENDEAIL